MSDTTDTRRLDLERRFRPILDRSLPVAATTDDVRELLTELVETTEALLDDAIAASVDATQQPPTDALHDLEARISHALRLDADDDLAVELVGIARDWHIERLVELNRQAHADLVEWMTTALGGTEDGPYTHDLNLDTNGPAFTIHDDRGRPGISRAVRILAGIAIATWVAVLAAWYLTNDDAGADEPNAAPTLTAVAGCHPTGHSVIVWTVTTPLGGPTLTVSSSSRDRWPAGTVLEHGAVSIDAETFPGDLGHTVRTMTIEAVYGDAPIVLEASATQHLCATPPPTPTTTSSTTTTTTAPPTTSSSTTAPPVENPAPPAAELTPPTTLELEPAVAQPITAAYTG